MRKINLNVNGQDYCFSVGRDLEPETTLSSLLREKLGYTDVRVVCNEGACGACTVLINGKSALSCMTLAVDCDGCNILTVAGLPDDDPVVNAFANMAKPGYGTAMQCGACTPGFVMEAHSLLNENPNPTQDEIKEALSGHLCRCGCYKGIVRAVENASHTGKENFKCKCSNHE